MLVRLTINCGDLMERYSYDSDVWTGKELYKNEVVICMSFSEWTLVMDCELVKWVGVDDRRARRCLVFSAGPAVWVVA